MKRPVVAGIAIAAFVLAAGGVLVLHQYAVDLEQQLTVAKSETASLRDLARRYSHDLEETVKFAAAAQRRTLETAGQAAQSAAERDAAQDLARRAEADSQQSRQELEQLRVRREQELNHMQEVLARIAKTRRTASGVVIELGNDSFQFDFDKADLRPENREVLSRIAGVLLMSNGFRLSIQGHTDDVGSADYNQKLSERRAASVAQYLESSGIDPAVVDVRGFGKTSPRAENKSRDARQKNRRVEIAVVDSLIHYQGIAGAHSKS
jgi:outer membrane protein OmpA-like peptidoglycan-associated protein